MGLALISLNFIHAEYLFQLVLLLLSTWHLSRIIYLCLDLTLRLSLGLLFSGRDVVNKLVLFIREDLATSCDHVDEVVREIKDVIRASSRLLPVVKVLFEVMQADLLNARKSVVTALVRDEQILKAVFVAEHPLFDKQILLTGLDVDQLNFVMFDCKQEWERALRTLDDVWKFL